MGMHTLDTTIDTPAADWFLNEWGGHAMTEAEYGQAYANRRPFAAHRVACFEDNRGRGIFYTYRDDADLEGFYALLELSMISDSYGWPANRAWRIYLEAYAEQESRLIAAELGIMFGRGPRK